MASAGQLSLAVHTPSGSGSGQFQAVSIWYDCATGAVPKLIQPSFSDHAKPENSPVNPWIRTPNGSAAQPGEHVGSAAAAVAQIVSQLLLQQYGSRGQMTASQAESLHPGVPLAHQQELPPLVRNLNQPMCSPQAKPDRLPLPSFVTP